ncbi:Zinc transporter ZupT, partial [Frankliniella fusca]
MDMQPEPESKPETEEPEYQCPTKRKSVRLDVMKRAVTSAIDRCQTSQKFSSHIVKQAVGAALESAAAILNVKEEDVKDLKASTSRWTVKRWREKNRKTEVQSLKGDMSE